MWRQMMALAAAVLTSWGAAAVEAKSEVQEKAKADAPEQAAAAEQSPEWIGAVERLRLLPRPGEIKTATVTANISALYALTPDESAKYAAAAREYEAALLPLAAKWLEEEKALRAEHEAKLVQLLPEAKRENARKLLEFSHANWVTPTDREAAFRKEYSEKATALRESKMHISAEEYEVARAKMQAWVKESRAKLNQQNQDLLKQIREMLAPEEAARLDQFDKSRPVPKAGK